ncbi:hypothetical protein IVB22_02565 [Bradyrhizobium sp. 190]|uniref:hypothetical protein n=1 Tax=Bradyrhizobium sp. 190 TaxID=2782658 RepID=UPI001FFA0622|nr:hypothetical protein [Bradyrhizobium sp. 190]MCK1511471.1 hypothetical protein [Bradyrhizobium sp. 190]
MVIATDELKKFAEPDSSLFFTYFGRFKDRDLTTCADREIGVSQPGAMIASTFECFDFHVISKT